MNAMACKWNGIFNVGEDFDDEDLLQTDWDVTPDDVTTTAVPVAGAACRLRSSTVTSVQTAVFKPPPQHISAHTVLEKASGSSTSQDVVKKIVNTKCLSAPAVSSVPICPSSFPVNGAACVGSPVDPVPAQSNQPNPNSNQPPDPFPDDFDDWDVDLDDLDDKVGQQVTEPAMLPPAPVRPAEDSVSPAKKMRPMDSGGQVQHCSRLRAPSHANQRVCAVDSRPSFTAPSPSSGLIQASPAVRPRMPLSSRGVNAPVSPHPCPVAPRAIRQSPQWHTATPVSRAAGHPSGTPYSPLSPFSSVTDSGAGSPAVTPRSLHTPVFTNHLVQLVSAANKTPQRPRSEQARPKTRRFPGPAGLLPQQSHGQSLDDIVVSVPQTPTHGAVARLRSQVPSSQVCEEEDFTGGPWARMKAEMGLDDRNPTCFLHSYSVVMVLRKAALKQLAKNKVPNMAVIVKTLTHTHADAKAVFRDPTGEIQGTVHRRLLEERQGELKAGSVLLLKQVGVFSPSHRNHYLNVTPNNLLRIYPPDGASWSSTQLSQHSLEEPILQQQLASHPPEGTVSQMDLLFEDDNECSEANRPLSPGVPQESTVPGGVEDSGWEADDLDKLLGELPEDSYIT